MPNMSVREMAQRLGVSIKTLQRWDYDGKLVAHRTHTNRRYYTEDQYLYASGQTPNIEDRKVVAYTRVSSHGQKDDLENQIDFIRTFANARGVKIDNYIKDVGSGLNYSRPNWNKLLKDVMNNRVSTIYITYKDRFIRFGFEWFEELCKSHDCQIIVLNNEKTSPEKELVTDLLSIIHVFSCRLYGLRKYKKVISEDLLGEDGDEAKP